MSMLDRMLYKMWLYEEVVPVARAVDAPKVFRLIAYGRVRGQNPKLSYFARKVEEAQLPFRVNLAQKKFPKKKRGAACKIKLVVEGMSDNLPGFLDSRRNVEGAFRSFLEGLKLKGWKLYGVVGRELKKAPKQSLKLLEA